MGASNERLRQAREMAGFKSATEAAKRFHWPSSTYSSHENGQTDPVPQRAAAKYARAFKVSVAWLLTGQGLMSDLEGLFSQIDVKQQAKARRVLELMFKE